MAVEWTLKRWLALNRNIYRATELQSLIKERTNIELSLTAVSALVNRPPSGIRFQTIQALCDALECNLCDFCNVRPNARQSAKYRQRKAAGEGTVRLYGGKQKRNEPESIFPDPNKFISSKKPRETSE